ncbi:MULTISPECIES: DNA cytosine methyltransferase [Bacteroides]|jgi:DNA (cytosine-5)-methyltransferase 1|uniref:DNA cytosine methyltransferase n=1 Tax=Bacteroides TaxID=816 RepID=UPI000821EA97|nr:MULTISPECIES: DNA (cytosine-5-)-methyltransferase [Bacteroides]SCI26975.1 Modification methylase BspRI [uncultured Bacteroides sp.]
MEYNDQQITFDIVSDSQLSINYSQPIRTSKKLKVLSLFSGCGGMDLGFEGDFIAPFKSISPHPEWIKKQIDNDWVHLKPTNFSLVFANDILKEAALTWTKFMNRYGYEPSIYRTESIVDLVKQHKQGGDIFPQNVDVVIGGFPCQDFSVSGKRKGFDSMRTHDGKIRTENLPTEETRGKLYYWMKEVIDITKPKIFIAENVKGLVNMGQVKDIIQADFSHAGSNGYIVLPPQVLHAGNYGVPESRERVFFIGIRKEALKEEILQALEKSNISKDLYPYPAPTHNCTLNNKKLAPPVILRDILKRLKEPEESFDPSQRFYSKAKYMGAHCQGQKEIDLNNIGPTIRSEHHGNIEFRRLSLEHEGKYQKELKEGLTERRLTPRECALIQTFPPDYQFVIPKDYNWKRFVVSASGAYKVIGNAVPPVLAYHIAMRIQDLWVTYFR